MEIVGAVESTLQKRHRMELNLISGKLHQQNLFRMASVIMIVVSNYSTLITEVSTNAITMDQTTN